MGGGAAREREEHSRRAHVVLRSHHVPDFVNGFVNGFVRFVRSETRQWQDEAAHEEAQTLGQRADLPPQRARAPGRASREIDTP